MAFVKFTKIIIDNYPSFQPILSIINIPANINISNISSTYFEYLTNEYRVKGSFPLVEEITERDSEYFMGSLDTDSLFSNISFEVTIYISANTLFENTERVEFLLKINYLSRFNDDKFYPCASGKLVILRVY